MALAPLEIVGTLFALLVGLVVAFAGYRIARALAGLAGFLVGAVFGLLVGIVFGPLGSLLAALALGILFALLFQFGFRFVGAALGGAALYAVVSPFLWPGWAVVVAVVAGIVAGFVFNKFMVVVATALLGASLAARSAFELVRGFGAPAAWERDFVVLVATLAIAAVGALSQGRAARGDR